MGILEKDEFLDSFFIFIWYCVCMFWGICFLRKFLGSKIIGELLEEIEEEIIKEVVGYLEM